jgi:hypothetical protein
MITFKSKAAQDLIVLKDFATYVLGVVGKPLGERGVITTEELEGAIAKLESAVKDAQREHAEHAGHFRNADDPFNDSFQAPAGLAQRVAPFLGMLRAARDEKADVHWGF